MPYVERRLLRRDVNSENKKDDVKIQHRKQFSKTNATKKLQARVLKSVSLSSNNNIINNKDDCKLKLVVKRRRDNIKHIKNISEYIGIFNQKLYTITITVNKYLLTDDEEVGNL